MFDYIDIHTHVNFPDFAGDRDEVMNKTLAERVAMINVGTDYQTSTQAVALAHQYEHGVWATVGLHPTDVGQEFKAAEFTKLAADSKVVAIGECGLDYFRIDSGDAKTKQKQQELFIKQLQLTIEVKKPLMIHCRNSYDDLLAILKSDFVTKISWPPGDIHFFAGDWSTARQFLDLGFTLSFTGVITFTHDYDEVVTNTPLDQILAETDAPYVAPVPYRGKRNEPRYVKEVVTKIAELKGLGEQATREALWGNATRVFNLA